MNNGITEGTQFRCLFEQSGTFKGELKSLGFAAFDYDIRNDYGETDFEVDLFKEIESAFEGGESLFDSFGSGADFVFAFFPCTRFSKWILKHMNGTAAQCRRWNAEKKIAYSMKMEEERSYMFRTFCKFVTVLLRKNIPAVIENPYDAEHYLTKYFPMLPGVIDKNRRDRGDYMEKPTQFYFINCKPSENFIFEAVAYHKKRREVELDQRTRSEISKEYANRFIREFIL